MDLKPANNPENRMAAKPTPKKAVESGDNLMQTMESISSIAGSFLGKDKVRNGNKTRFFGI